MKTFKFSIFFAFFLGSPLFGMDQESKNNAAIQEVEEQNTHKVTNGSTGVLVKPKVSDEELKGLADNASLISSAQLVGKTLDELVL